ncbi:SDR family oxidoreductase [Lampropedia aestuarii]|uniref:SDR family oxidoreductase n=1 Tax=Lampropedia aestuarii TaxID=2562762 RepID=A0A4S5BRA3_9BURK|nr:SDR family NAD(P)-dependent oxidoreductase [Lampropedia aestuarii]MDH5856660.1 SDR family NAD(P)-dependent oxidoreductase [Lampropedia aestuarii]THJ34919.1 SDR family oxidoreductase [Lampropedia aestuarii]
MNTYDYKGQVAVVTGGAQGIGLAVVERLLEGGATVAIWDLDAQALAAAQQHLAGKGQVAVYQTNIADLASVQQAHQQTVSEWGPIAILVNSAGIAGANAPVVDYPAAEWNRVMDVNLNGTFHVNQEVVKGMIASGYGRVVNVASIAGKEGNPNASAYSASKAAVIALTKSLGKETAGLNIAVNAITPAAAKTKIFEQMAQQHIDYMLSKIPRGRFVLVNEIAAMVAWLVSEENSFTTGAVFDLSGGRATY